ATILATLAQAAGMPSGEIARTVSTRGLADGLTTLVGHLRASGKQLTVLLDALDEESMPGEGAEQPSSDDLEDLGREVLRPLADDSASPIRLLLGGRREVLERAGFGPAGEDRRVIDLDGFYEDSRALRQWARTVLLGHGGEEDDGSDHGSPWLDARGETV